jgi:prepilin-type N-terminal cleavage/methylation domain-containing protein
MNRRHDSKKGFTIVELLVVIVVIGILAAIVIVAYQGVTVRAQNVKTIAAARQWQQILNSYALLNGNNLNLNDSQTSNCLGAPSDYPATKDFPAGACVSSWAYASPTLNKTLSSVGTISAQTWTSTQYSNFWGDNMRGISYGTFGLPGSSTSYIVYVLTGNTDCGLATTERYYANNVTSCTIPVTLQILIN